PVKYWKAQHLVDRKFIYGFAFNRKWSHTTIDACIMVALWSNEYGDEDSFSLEGFDISKETGELISIGMLPVKQVFTLYSKEYYDNRSATAETDDGILVSLNG